LITARHVRLLRNADEEVMEIDDKDAEEVEQEREKAKSAS
jgi:hypothetical protein